MNNLKNNELNNNYNNNCEIDFSVITFSLDYTWNLEFLFLPFSSLIPINKIRNERNEMQKVTF